MMPNNLYFVESIHYLQDEEQVQVILSQEESTQETFRQVLLSRDQMRMRGLNWWLREGWYVYYDENYHERPFSYGNGAKYARTCFIEFRQIQEKLLSSSVLLDDSEYRTRINSILSSNTLMVTSFHVNVGHGNCSIILLQNDDSYQLWMIDCSVGERVGNNQYEGNLEACLDEIATRVNVPSRRELHIDRFFLTHTHYDHFNGITYLADNHYIDGSTIFYLNLYYNWARKSYISILNILYRLGVKFIEPGVAHSNNEICFIHPECRIYRSKSTAVDLSSAHRVVKHVNDSSFVVVFDFGHRRMAFPGDLEKDGFNAMTHNGSCSPYLFWIDYYAISHHGSSTGHPNVPCCQKSSSASPIKCISHSLRASVLMGRDGACPGIYSSSVVNFFRGKGLIFSEKDNAGNPASFVVLDWATGNYRHY